MRTPKPKRDERAFVVPIDSIKPWARNPRKNDEAVDAVATSITEFDFNDPIIVCRATGEIVAGHTRWKAAKRLGLVEVPIRYTDITPAKAYAYALAANRTGEIATWDDPALGALLAEIKRDDADLVLRLGFDTSEVRRFIVVHEHLRASTQASDEAPDPPKNPVSREGDVWELGEHRLLCGSCVDLGKLCEPGTFRLLVTDPPYGVNYASKTDALNRIIGGGGNLDTIANDGASHGRTGELWAEWFASIHRQLLPGACFYITGPQGGSLLAVLQGLAVTGFELRHTLIWLKQRLVLGLSDYHYKHEAIMYGWLDGSDRHKVEDRTQTSVWEIDRPQSSMLHPTMKPVELYARAYRNSSDPGDRVLEPFAGSGTAFVAAEQEGRICYGSEIAPAYCDVIVERWQEYSGKKATRRSA